MSAPAVLPPKKQAALQPANVIFRYLQSKSRVRVWLVDHPHAFIEGVVSGFDEFMNLVLDAAAEVNTKKNTTKNIGRIMLKGDNITLITYAQPQTQAMSE